LIDLPGLIHASNKSQSEEDVELIKSLVKDYISKQRTIMLAVVSAKNDYANQIILKMCREFDTKGARTLGIITKPDFLRPDSENESTWLDLARNKDIYFELGWHFLKNRADDQHSISFTQRNLEEQAFFKAKNCASLSRSMMGVNPLRDRLSRLLFDHLREALPELEDELNAMLSKTLGELEVLGKCRDSLADQRIFLAELATSASNIIRMGCDGIYEAPFFGSVDIDARVDAEQNFVRLRAVVQYLNMGFAEEVRLKGHTFQIEKDSGLEKAEGTAKDVEPWVTAKNGARNTRNSPIKMQRQQAIKWISHIQERLRGRELPGVFNPMIIGHLFREQSTMSLDHLFCHYVYKKLHFVLQSVRGPPMKRRCGQKLPCRTHREHLKPVQQRPCSYRVRSTVLFRASVGEDRCILCLRWPSPLEMSSTLPSPPNYLHCP
jgi:hypothetical protein